MGSKTSLRSRINATSTEFRLALLLFVLIWLYLIIRSYTVFFLHDEIVTKWSYVVHWNPFPNQGVVDANNHFLLSLLAGFFTRLFNSDSMFLMRLGSVLSFPIYFWSVYRLKFLFQQKWNFYALLLALTTCTFLIEFFGFARGYGLALAFLVFSLQQTISYFHSGKKAALIGALLGWLLAIYASLTLLPFAIAGVFLLGFHTIRRLSGAEVYVWIIPIVVSILPLAYFIEYSFLLKELGKLYYGGTEGFFETTIHTLTIYVWSAKSLWIDVALVLITCFILFVTLKSYWKSKSLFDPKTIFSLFFFLAISNILAQRWILDVNFPEDRTATYLVVFFFGALFFSIDQFTHRKPPAFISIGVSLLYFALNFNFSHSLLFFEEHEDEELVTMIPESVKGTPPTTSGRWNMENEMTRQLNLPLRIYQGNDQPSDTLVDYMIFYPNRRKDILDHYKVIHQDQISGLALLERKKFLNRRKVAEKQHEIIDRAEYQTFYSSSLDGPKILRCSGQFEKMTDEKEVFIVFASEDTLAGKLCTYECVPMAINKKVDESGQMDFDFSYAMNALDGAHTFAVYIWNQKREELQGKIKLEVYEIEE